MSRRASARIQKHEDDAAEKNRSIYTDVEKKYKRSRRRHLDMLENSNFGCHRSNVDVVITASGGEVDDVASESAHDSPFVSKLFSTEKHLLNTQCSGWQEAKEDESRSRATANEQEATWADSF